MNVGDTVKLNGGVRNLHIQLRARYRAGLTGKIVKLHGRTHLDVEIEDQGTVKVARLWVDKVE